MKSLGTVTLETERLILCRFELKDAQGMYNNWASDEKVTKFLAWDVHKDVHETENILKNWISKYDNLNYYNWVVEVKDTHEVIGSICDVGVSTIHEVVTLAYCYGSKYWGHGYATEALRRVIEFLLNDVECHLVEATYRSTNPASGKVMEKAGMKKEAILRKRRKDKYTLEFADEIICSIMKDEL